MRITVTAGHGAGDPGAVAHGFNEGDLMTELRDIVAMKLRAAGHQVVTDGGAGVNLPLADAIKRIAASNVAIELHTNAAANPSARGVEVISLPAQAPLARRVAAAIAGVLETPLRGDHGWIDQARSARGRLGFVGAGGMVVEVFFLSNVEELAKYRDRYWNVASAIAKAVTS